MLGAVCAGAATVSGAEGPRPEGPWAPVHGTGRKVTPPETGARGAAAWTAVRWARVPPRRCGFRRGARLGRTAGGLPRTPAGASKSVTNRPGRAGPTPKACSARKSRAVDGHPRRARLPRTARTPPKASRRRRRRHPGERGRDRGGVRRDVLPALPGVGRARRHAAGGEVGDRAGEVHRDRQGPQPLRPADLIGGPSAQVPPRTRGERDLDGTRDGDRGASRRRHVTPFAVGHVRSSSRGSLPAVRFAVLRHECPPGSVTGGHPRHGLPVTSGNDRSARRARPCGRRSPIRCRTSRRPSPGASRPSSGARRTRTTRGPR